MDDLTTATVSALFLIGLGIESGLMTLLLCKFPNNDSRGRMLGLVGRATEHQTMRILRNLFLALCVALIVWNGFSGMFLPIVSIATRGAVIRLHDIQTKLHTARESLKKAE